MCRPRAKCDIRHENGVALITVPSGETVLLDPEDVGLLSGVALLVCYPRGRAQVVTRPTTVEGRRAFRSRTTLARSLVRVEPGQEVDHANGNPLDNRKRNLRVCSRVQNASNIKRRKDNSSGYKGVSFMASRRRWRARISVARREHHLGLFDTAEEAAHAYNKAAVAMHGEFARLNPVGGKCGN